MSSKTITLAGGCFWCLEAVYDRVSGVLDVESGYANGHVQHPTYDDICGGQTGHAEVVRLEFDPSVVSLRELLEIFFVIHDPTTLNRQGNDVGPQYRSGIYWQETEQRDLAMDVIRELEDAGVFGAPVVTEVAPLQSYWPAESYHQDYFAQHPNQGYCAYVVAPKVRKFQQTFARLAKG